MWTYHPRLFELERIQKYEMVRMEEAGLAQLALI